jgi:hypothetical protein
MDKDYVIDAVHDVLVDFLELKSDAVGVVLYFDSEEVIVTPTSKLRWEAGEEAPTARGIYIPTKLIPKEDDPTQPDDDLCETVGLALSQLYDID